MSEDKVNDKMKKAFRDKLGDYKYPPREGMWDDIVDSLPKPKKNYKKILIWAGSTAAMFTTLFILAGPYVVKYISDSDLFGGKNSEKEKTNYASPIHKQQDDHDPYIFPVPQNHDQSTDTQSSGENEAAGVNKDFTNEKTKTERTGKQRSTYNQKQDIKIKNQAGGETKHTKEEYKGITVDTDFQQQHALQTDSLNVITDDNILEGDSIVVSEPEDAEESEQEITHIKPKKDYSSWSFALSSKNIVYNGYHKQWGSMQDAGSATDQIIGGKRKFSHPVNINLTVRKQFNRRWALESGLSYTYLWSQETIFNSLSPTVVTNVEIHNLGIPLSIEYTFFNSRKISIYSKYGVMVEKTNGSKDQINDWQVSTWLSGGISYKLSKNFALFGEPGVTYYFDNNTPLPTLRNEAPFNFDITAGIRFYPFSH